MVPLGRCFSFKWSVIDLNQQIFVLYIFSKIQTIHLDHGKVTFLEQLGLWLHYFSPGSWRACCTALQAWWVKADTAFIFFWQGEDCFFQYGKSLFKGGGSLSPSSLWFFCPRMQQSILVSGLPALLSLHLGPKRWNPNQILNFQKLWNMLHKPQRNFDQKFTACLYFFAFFFFFFSS